MSKNIYDVVLAIEYQMAQLFTTLKGVTQISDNIPLFEVLEKQATNFYGEVREVCSDKIPPVFDDTAVFRFQKELKDTLFDHITAEQDKATILEQVAKANEFSARFYENMSSTCTVISDYYKELSENLDKFAKGKHKSKELLIAGSEQVEDN
jgi:hypothetical protein